MNERTCKKSNFGIHIKKNAINYLLILINDSFISISFINKNLEKISMIIDYSRLKSRYIRRKSMERAEKKKLGSYIWLKYQAGRSHFENKIQWIISLKWSIVAIKTQHSIDRSKLSTKIEMSKIRSISIKSPFFVYQTLSRPE